MLLQKKLADKKVILASQSPRRQELLKELGLDFSIAKIEVDESYPSELSREKITEFISAKKANSYTTLNENEILITADTLVWLENEILGKPKDYKDAFAMIQKMSGKTHEVFTSVTLKTLTKQITFSDTTSVTFTIISAEEIDYYLTNYQPFDKAGAYGIQDWLGYAKIKEINGCYYNVMGLPLAKLYEQLREL